MRDRDRDERRAVLLRNAWFRELPGALADAIVSDGVVRRYRDQLIYAEGDPPNGLFALLSGEVRVRHTGHDAGSTALMILSPGGWFGEAAMVDGQPRSSDALAVGTVQALQVTPVAFARLTAGDVAHYAPFARLVCAQYRAAMKYIVGTSNLPLRVRLAKRLVALAASHGADVDEGRRIDLQLSQEALADMVGVSRQSLNKALGQLRREGLVAVRYAQITVRDAARLQAIARASTEFSMPV
jgi:CRP/FNR family cyclic AMP-dependent transcriptional regulator